MAAQSKPNESPEQDDSWEKLAENLFGINFQKSGDERDVPPPVAPPTPPPAPFDSSQTAGDEPASAEELPAVPVPTAVEGSADVVEGPTDDEPAAVSDSDSPAEPNKEADTFWDALNEWEWDDEAKPSSTYQKEEPAERSPARERPKQVETPVSPRYEDSAVSESAADFRDEYVDDPDFGLGLLEDEKDEAVKETAGKATSEPLSSTTAEAPADAESATAQTADTEQGEAPPKRRRRRRRRRSARSAATETSSEETKHRDDVTPDVVDEEPETEESTVADPADTSQDEPRSPRRPGRRRSSRRRQTPSKDTEAETPETPDEEQPSSIESVETDLAYQQPTQEQEAATDEGESSGRKIPTWAEAISFLLHKQPSEKPGGDSRAGGGRKPSRTTSGRSGGRRRRQ